MPYAVGDLVMIYHPYGSELQAPSKKLVRNWLGPVKIQAILDDTHYICTDWLGKLIPKKFHVNRLKPFSIFLGELCTEKMKLDIAENMQQLHAKWANVQSDQDRNEEEKVENQEKHKPP